jgi:hypothetical protein
MIDPKQMYRNLGMKNTEARELHPPGAEVEPLEVTVGRNSTA